MIPTEKSILTKKINAEYCRRIERPEYQKYTDDPAILELVRISAENYVLNREERE